MITKPSRHELELEEAGKRAWKMVYRAEDPMPVTISRDWVMDECGVERGAAANAIHRAATEELWKVRKRLLNYDRSDSVTVSGTATEAFANKAWDVVAERCEFASSELARCLLPDSSGVTSFVYVAWGDLVRRALSHMEELFAPDPVGSARVTNEESPTRAEQVLAAMRRVPNAGTPARYARVLNFDAPCDWCPVGPPRRGEQCAAVPVASRRAVARVLRALVNAGRVEHVFAGTRMRAYVVAGASK